MTREEREARIERLRQEPAFKDLIRLLRGQDRDRVDAFLDECEETTAEEEHHERPNKTDR